MLDKASFVRNYCDVLPFSPSCDFCLGLTLRSFWPFLNIALFKDHFQVLRSVCIEIAPQFEVLRFVKTLYLSNCKPFHISLIVFLGRKEGRFFRNSAWNIVKVLGLANFGFQLSKFLSAWIPGRVVELDPSYFGICDVLKISSRVIDETSCNIELIR